MRILQVAVCCDPVHTAAAAGVAGTAAVAAATDRSSSDACYYSCCCCCCHRLCYAAKPQLLSLLCAGEVISSAQAPLDAGIQLALERGDIGVGFGYLATGQQKGSKTTAVYYRCEKNKRDYLSPVRNPSELGRFLPPTAPTELRIIDDLLAHKYK